MGAVEFFSVLLGNILAWPVLVFVLVLMFRKPLAELIGRMKSYEGLGQKVTFGEGLAGTEESVRAAVADIAAPPEAQELQPAPADEWEELAREAETNPSFAIVTAWERLSSVLDTLIRSSIDADDLVRRSSGRSWPTQLDWVHESEKRGIVGANFTQAAYELRGLRNRVAHGQAKPTSGEAVAYVESAKELARAAHVLARLTVQRRGQGDASKAR
jgi:hypothetical protein